MYCITKIPPKMGIIFALHYVLQRVRRCLSRLIPLPQGACRPCTQTKELPPLWPTKPPRLSRLSRRSRRRGSRRRGAGGNGRLTLYEAAAARAGLSIGEYFRTLSDAPGQRPRAARRPAVEHKEVARLVGLLGNLTSNVNQLARAANTAGYDVAENELKQIGDEVRGMRSAVMKALGYGD